MSKNVYRLKQICYSAKSKPYYIWKLKGTVSRDYRPFFGLKYLLWAPYEQAKMVLRTFFSSREDMKSQSSKFKNQCRLSQRLRRHLNFSFDTNVFIFWNYCYGFVNTSKNLFSSDWSFKIFVKHSKFSKRVSVIHNYANTVSA